MRIEGGIIFEIAGRVVGPDEPPLVIAEIGINHEGDIAKAKRMVSDVAAAGGECVKIQSHVLEDEMVPNDVVPTNADESIWEIVERCSLTENEEKELKEYAETLGLIFLSTPFSRMAADRLNSLGVQAFKIGSGECNNYPLVEHIASFGKPVILSTGMNTLDSVRPSVEIMRTVGVPFALLHCTSIYPTPFEFVRLGAIEDLQAQFPDAVVGLSDHSLSISPCIGAVALGASILERHFTSDKTWPGPDIEVSMDPEEFQALIRYSQEVFAARGGTKEILDGEAGTIAFAYASVVTTRDIAAGSVLSRDNIWCKRPGTGEFLAADYQDLIGAIAARDLPANVQVKREDIRR